MCYCHSKYWQIGELCRGIALRHLSRQDNDQNADFAKYVGPTVKPNRNLTGPIKPTFFSDQMSAIVRDRIFVFTEHVCHWLHEKNGLSCARPRKTGMHLVFLLPKQQQRHKSCEQIFMWRKCTVQYDTNKLLVSLRNLRKSSFWWVFQTLCH